LFLLSLYFCTLFWNALGDSFRWGSLIHQSMKSMSQKVLKEILCYHYQMLFKSMCTKQLGILLQKYKACGVVASLLTNIDVITNNPHDIVICKCPCIYLSTPLMKYKQWQG
jgi:hypothetical protein